jgi:hypothetical protein
MSFFPFLVRLTLWANSEEGHVTVDASILTGCFQQPIETFKQCMFHFDLSPTISTDDVMVFIACDLIG